jgi:hypothetical protein
MGLDRNRSTRQRYYYDGAVRNPNRNVLATNVLPTRQDECVTHRGGNVVALSALSAELLLAGFAGGILGAAIGGVPALSLAGFAILAGESLRVPETTAVDSSAAIDAVGPTGAVGFGPVFGPHVAFAGGVAAAAYAGRKEMFDTGFRYHQAKRIAQPLGSRPDVLLVGGAFGVVGVLVAQLSAAGGVPVDPIMLGVVVSGFLHRIALGYPVLGYPRDGWLDMSPFERGERWERQDNAPGKLGRYVVEPWLPDHYEWENVAVLGVGVGIGSGFLAVETGSVFLPFGIAAASLAFFALGLYSFPVTHHMALPAGIAAVAVDAEPAVAVVVAGGFGLLGAITGEAAQRVLYAHADTHLDPPAVSIVVTSLAITLLATAGVFDPGPVPYPQA